MFKMAPGTKEKLLAYMKRNGIADQIPSPVLNPPHYGERYEWVLAFYNGDQIAAAPKEMFHTVDGIDFVIDCAEVFLDDLRERTLVATRHGFEFEPPSRLRPVKDWDP